MLDANWLYCDVLKDKIENFLKNACISIQCLYKAKKLTKSKENKRVNNKPNKKILNLI